MARPKLGGQSESELDRAEQQFDQFEKEVKELTQDRMNEAPKIEAEQQTKLSSKDLERSKDLYLKPIRTISVRDKFNEKFREKYNFDKEYVRFIAENKEIIGEDIEIWTRPYAGISAEFWRVPVNKPIWAPRYLAEQLKKCKYHRLVMQDRPTNSDGHGTYYGTMVAESTVQRLDAHPVYEKKSVFMGESAFR